MSAARLRLLSLIQQGVIPPNAIRPPLTTEERSWLRLAPIHTLAEFVAGDGQPLPVDRQEQPSKDGVR